MLAPSVVPERYSQWNSRYGAPSGWPNSKKRIWDVLKPRNSIEQSRGPFSIQTNNTTREFEYPWAYESAQVKPGVHVLELGGGLSGFQFVLDQSGCHVVNVDPGMEAKGLGWPCDLASMEKLNRLFGTHVDLRNTTMEYAKLGERTMDCAFSISVIEHLTDEEIVSAMRCIHRCLKRGGLFILTVDLFLNLSPFCSRVFNKFGRNQSIRWLVELEDWKVVVGKPKELLGFDCFVADEILSNLDQYLIGRSYPAMAQCLVLKKN